MNVPGHPILTCEDAAARERAVLGDDESRIWDAMVRAGRGVAGAVQEDFREIGDFPQEGRVLVLVGKGHNGGDALIAAETLLSRFPRATAQVVFAFGQRALRPLAARAWRQLSHAARGRVATSRSVASNSGPWDLLLDGLFGFSFRPPANGKLLDLIAAVNGASVRLRAAVDLPSGLGGNAVVRADFTYATGIVKSPAIDGTRAGDVGRLRYIDLGFFDRDPGTSRLRILTPEVLEPLRRLRDPQSHKYTHGNLFIIGGSRSFPGAVLLAVEGALRSGVGLVTAFVPESLAAAFAARAPAAIWVGWPETPSGGLALEGAHLFHERSVRSTAVLLGPGMSREPETLAFAKDLVASLVKPVVMDADALRPDIVRAGKAPRIVTPHMEEYRRILVGDDFHSREPTKDAVVLLKGRLTGITRARSGWFSPFGGPVLARGGTGDVLAGLVAGLLAQHPEDPDGAACRGAVWHGIAADLLARERGQVAVCTTDLLDFLAPALRAGCR